MGASGFGAAQLGSADEVEFHARPNHAGVAAGLFPDSDAPTRQAINKLDGVSVHTLRFGDAGIPDEAAVEAIRAAYHLRGWKHLVTTSDHGSPVHNGTTDVWVVLDGIECARRGGSGGDTQKPDLVTVAGNLSPVDLMHLRGHFGIPRLDADDVKNAPVSRRYSYKARTGCGNALARDFASLCAIRARLPPVICRC